MASGWTLDDALNFGQGIERPFRCPDHDDTNASASVNVLKGVWVCYACRAAGAVKERKAPTAAQLAAMLNPEEACRVYPESWLELFRDFGYWLERFPDWLCAAMGLGTDPFSGNATFPVRTEQGKLAGVGHRIAEPAEGEPRYKYPLRWSASRTLGAYRMPNHDPVGVLTEGYADTCSVREIGPDSYAVYGAGLHAPQLEMVRRLNKKTWLLGFDMDTAGDRATEMAYELLAPEFTYVARIEWPEKDPAECTPAQRKQAIYAALGSVGSGVYGRPQDLLDRWDGRARRAELLYRQQQRKEVA